jgi:hypothetical protein
MFDGLAAWLAAPDVWMHTAFVKRFLIEFASDDGRHYTPRTVGVTAWTINDALRLISERFRGETPEPVRITEDPDLSAVWPGSLGVSVWPGIWHPPLNMSCAHD